MWCIILLWLYNKPVKLIWHIIPWAPGLHHLWLPKYAWSNQIGCRQNHVATYNKVHQSAMCAHHFLRYSAGPIIWELCVLFVNVWRVMTLLGLFMVLIIYFHHFISMHLYEPIACKPSMVWVLNFGHIRLYGSTHINPKQWHAVEIRAWICNYIITMDIITIHTQI